MAKALFPILKVRACGKCKHVFKKPIEPYIRGDNGLPVIGLKCEACGYKKELTLTKGLPLVIDQSNAVFGAMSQLVTVAFMSNKHIQMTGGGINE